MTDQLVDEWHPTQAEFDLFAEVSGDDNPIHVDAEFSERTRFGRTVSHGMLIYSRLWGLIRNRYPEARQRSQTLMFPNPCFTGEPVRLAVTAIDGKRFSVEASRKADGALLLVGETEIA